MNGPSMQQVKPTFLIIGEQKAGTGWLRDRLLEHPDVFICQKEVNFFNRRSNFKKGTDWYFNLFTNGAGKAAIGEKSPEYFWLDSGRSDYVQNIDEEIEKTLGHVPLILSLRNPIDRAISAFMHHLRHRGRRVNPHRVPAHSPLQLLRGAAGDLGRYGVIERGFFAARLERYRRRFDDRLLTLVLEDDIIGNPQQALRDVCRHIGIDFDNASFDFHENKKESKPSLTAIKIGYWLSFLRPVARALDKAEPYRLALSADERAELADHYREDVQKTRALLGRDVWQKDWPV